MTPISKELISRSAATFLNLRHFPACLDIDQTAAILGRHPDHVPILVEGGFLQPLGDPPKNGVKLFAACEILEKAADVAWLNETSEFLTKWWQRRNANYKNRTPV
jgi:hypothetical protein